MLGHVSFCPLDWDILISSFKNIKLSFSNYLSLKTLEVHEYKETRFESKVFSLERLCPSSYL